MLRITTDLIAYGVLDKGNICEIRLWNSGALPSRYYVEYEMQTMDEKTLVGGPLLVEHDRSLPVIYLIEKASSAIVQDLEK